MTKKMIIDAYCSIRTIDTSIPDDVLDFMKESALKYLAEIEGETLAIENNIESPYIEQTEIVINRDRKYNPNYGDNRECECGHTYDRHFDSYEKMEACGCKYCECFTFVEKKIS